VSRIDLAVVILLPLAVIGLAVIFGVVLPKSARRRKLHGPIPVAVLSAERDVLPARPYRPPTPGHTSTVEPSLATTVTPTAPVQPVVQVSDRQMAQAGTGTHGFMAETKVATDGPHLRLATSLTDSPPPRPDGRTPRKTARVTEGTLQFLPGRLEVIEGRDMGQEIRFVRQPGDDGTTVTFGRNDGPQYRHVQLHEPTVSRLHAKMSLEGKRWRLTNMSQTNPVVVNGAPLQGEGSSLVLSEGDRVEMGEVVFVYRGK